MSLQLDNISFGILNKKGEVNDIIRDFSFVVEPGEFVTFFGKSGCGKSTLLNIISGLLKPTTGFVKLNGVELGEPDGDIAFVFQETTLIPFKNVQQNVEFGLEIKGIKEEERHRISDEILKKVGLYEHRLDNPIKNKFSGGMKQRVEIAGVLVDQSTIILMDEPFSALDDITREELQLFLLEVWKDFNRTIIFVTHSKDEAIMLSDRIVLLPAIPSQGSPTIVNVELSRPRNPLSMDFLKYKEILSDHLKQ